MFRLIIKRADASIYWTEHFNSLNELNLWLAKEQLRPYWLQEYTTEITDLTPPPPSQGQIDAIAAKKAVMLALKTRLDALDALPDLTAIELKEMARKLYKLIKLKSITDV